MYRALQLQRSCRAGFRLASRRSASQRVLSAGPARVPVTRSYVRLQNAHRVLGSAGTGPLLFPCRRYSGKDIFPTHRFLDICHSLPIQTCQFTKWSLYQPCHQLWKQVSRMCTFIESHMSVVGVIPFATCLCKIM